jgi:tetratricopeptide (TPR) repeat protein
MKNQLANKIYILAAVLLVLSLVSLTSAQTNQKNQENDSSKELSKARAIDTSSYDKEIVIAAKILKRERHKEASKRKLAAAYAARGFALARAAQYKAALGDLRRCLRLDPNNKRAKGMHDAFIDIYKVLNRKIPEEGKEPQPIPFNKN